MEQTLIRTWTCMVCGKIFEDRVVLYGEEAIFPRPSLPNGWSNGFGCTFCETHASQMVEFMNKLISYHRAELKLRKASEAI